MTLEKLELEISQCTNCDLHIDRRNSVFAKGDHTSDIMICGMVPANEENEMGVPFVGRSGKLLDTILDEVGLTGKVYITNLVKCFLAAGEKLDSSCIDACSSFLDRQILITRPKVIITLGGDASYYLTKSNAKSLSDIRGDVFSYDKHTKIIPTYHPSYLLRKGGKSSQEYPTVLEDLRLAKKLIAE